MKKPFDFVILGRILVILSIGLLAFMACEEGDPQVTGVWTRHAPVVNEYTLSGTIVDASDDSPIQGATIDVSGPEIASASSNANGDYTITALEEGNYSVNVSKAGYQNGYTNIAINGASVTQDFSLNPGATENYMLTGYVYDATTDLALAGATVSISGPVAANTTTNLAGRYEMNDLPSGSYTMTVSRSGYFSEVRHLAIDGASLEHAAVFLSPEILAGQIRIVLTWDDQPQDLDAHLWIPWMMGDWYHVYFASTGFIEMEPYAVLDVDERYGHGPETITIGAMYESGTYYYTVHNYSGTPSMTISNAVVRVYDPTGLYGTYEIPVSGSGTCWNLLEFDYDGSYVVVNEISDISPFGYLDAFLK